VQKVINERSVALQVGKNWKEPRSLEAPPCKAETTTLTDTNRSS
jgi:hypothetical protein